MDIARIAALGDPLWNENVGWRWMFGFGFAPAVLLLVALAFVPKSPRWLIKQGWKNTYSLEGGIAAYASEVDKSVGWY